MASSSNNACFICEEVCENDKLSRIGDKGKEGFELLIKNSEDGSLLSKWNDVKNTVVRYHQTCKTELYNLSKTAKRARQNDENAERVDQKQKKKRSYSDGQRKPLIYKDKCILCNKEVILTAHKKVKTDYTRPDNVTSHKLMERLNIYAD
mgnify:FL=1